MNTFRSTMNYAPGPYRGEANAFLRECMGSEKYDAVMTVGAGRSHPYVAARVFLSDYDWERFVWIEQHGSLEGFSAV